MSSEILVSVMKTKLRDDDEMKWHSGGNSSGNGEQETDQGLSIGLVRRSKCDHVE